MKANPTSSPLHLYIHGQEASACHRDKELISQYHRSTTLPIDYCHYSTCAIAFNHLHNHPERMISTKRLVQMAKKWQKMAARGRKRISFGVAPKSNTSKKVAEIAEKGHFVAYASDGKRYMVPLTFLQRAIFQELLKMAEEEFGLSIDGAITFPCDSTIVDYIMSLLQGDMSRQIENALVASLSSTRCFSSSVLPQSHPYQHMPLEGY